MIGFTDGNVAGHWPRRVGTGLSFQLPTHILDLGQHSDIRFSGLELSDHWRGKKSITSFAILSPIRMAANNSLLLGHPIRPRIGFTALFLGSRMIMVSLY